MVSGSWFMVSLPAVVLTKEGGFWFMVHGFWMLALCGAKRRSARGGFGYWPLATLKGIKIEKYFFDINLTSDTNRRRYGYLSE